MDIESKARRDAIFAQADAYIDELAKTLSPIERETLLLLREDGRGNYDRRLTRARSSLHEKKLADSHIDMGFGRNPRIATVQKPTRLGMAVAQRLRNAEAGK